MSEFRSSASKIVLESYDDLFEERGYITNDYVGQVREISLDEIHEFKNHPFRVTDDEKMDELVASIKEYGVLTPGIVRPREEGGFELLSGHRRKHALRRLGRVVMPVIITHYSDDEATITMVDANIQREDILPSEKAKAYKMKYDAMKHQGSKAGGLSLDIIGEWAGESGKTVQRYIWLTRLDDKLLRLVDDKKIGFAQGVDLSFLTNEQQTWLVGIFEEQKIVISTTQSSILKKLAKSGALTLDKVKEVLLGLKVRHTRFVLNGEKVRQYFPVNYSKDDIENILYELLEEWHKAHKGV